MKRLFIAFAAYCALSVAAFAQNGSWEDQLKSITNKEEKFRFLIDFVNDHPEHEQAENVLERATELASELTQDSLLAMLQQTKGNFEKTHANYSGAWDRYSAAKSIYLKARLYNEAGEVVYKQMVLLVEQNLPDSIIRLLDQNKALFRLSEQRLQNRVQLAYGNAYYMLGRNEEALNTFLGLLDGMEVAQDTQAYISLCMNVAQLQSQFDSSMNWYRKILPLAEEADKDLHASLLMAMGWQYSQRDDKIRDSALYYFKEAEKRIGYLKSPLIKVNLCTYIADYFFERAEYILAQEYFIKAWELGKENGVEYPILLHNVAMGYVALNRRDSASHYFERYKEAVKNSEDNYELLLLHQLNAGYLRMKGDSCSVEVLSEFEKAIAYAVKLEDPRHGVKMINTHVVNCLLDSSLNVTGKARIAESILEHCRFFYGLTNRQGQLLNYTDFLKNYASLEALYGDKVHALELYRELTAAYGEMNRKKYMEGLDEALIKYKADLKDTEIRLLTEKNRAERNMRNLIIAGLAFALISLFVIFLLYRRENRTRKQLDERNNQVEELLREIHHRVKNNLQIVTSFIHIQLDKLTDPQAAQALKDTAARIAALASLHHSLYQHEDLSSIHLETYIRKLCDDILHTLPHDSVRIDCELEALKLDMDKAIPLGLVISELITNALKHAFTEKSEDARITVQLVRKEKWELTVSDNGKGIPGNLNEAGQNSIGLRLIQNLVKKQVKGEFSFSNQNGAHFTVTFLPGH